MLITMPVRTVISIWPLFLGLALIGLAVGVQGSLLGVRAEMEGFEDSLIGLLMSCYFAGFLGGYLSMIVWLAGYKLIPASEASILNQSASAWIVLFAWMVLGESIGLRKVTGLVLTMAGVAIMLLV